MPGNDDKNFDVTTLPGLKAAVYAHPPGHHHNFEIATGTFCPDCQGDRRMALSALYWEDRWAPQRRPSSFPNPRAGEPSDLAPANDPDPALYAAICLQCQHVYVLVVHPGPDGIELAALPSSYGGLATPNTHPAVGYYLDQANRARSVGAFSAAAAMYRAALDQLLFHEGFQDGMLGKKITDLVNADSPPAWFKDLNPAYLTVINEFGSGAIHPNDGDHEKQAAIDRDLTEAVDALFAEILDRVYERPEVARERLARIKAATSILRKNKVADEN